LSIIEDKVGGRVGKVARVDEEMVEKYWKRFSALVKILFTVVEKFDEF
jgi:hypothetical protein